MAITKETKMLRVSVSGDAESGWMVDLHDGTFHQVLRPEAKDELEAVRAALDEAFPDGAANDTKNSRKSKAAFEHEQEKAQAALQDEQIKHQSKVRAPFDEEFPAINQADTKSNRKSKADS